MTRTRAFPDVDELYMNLLRAESESVTITDGTCSFMVLPDLYYEKSVLQMESLMLVQRKSVSFVMEDVRWIYGCSCQPDWSREMFSSSNHYCTSYEDFIGGYPQCIHRKVASKIYHQYDRIHQILPHDFLNDSLNDIDHDYTTETNVVEAYQLNDIPVVRVWGENVHTFGLVSVLRQKYYCFCCKKNFCDHTKYMRSLSATSVELDVCPPAVSLLYELFSVNDGIRRPVNKQKIICHSTKKIPFLPYQTLTECLNTGLVTNIKSDSGSLICIPEDKICKQCNGNLDMADPVSSGWIAAEDVMVVTNTHLEKGTVFYRPCPHCDSVTLFDGWDKCFLNMGSYLVGHDVLRSYMHNFLHGRRPLYTFYGVFVDMHVEYGNTDISTMFSYHKLRAAWLSYLKLLDIDLNTGFSCPDCGDDGPDVIICDGTSVSFQRRMWTWKEEKMSTSEKPPVASSFRDRVFIQDPSLRKLLHRFAAGGDIVRGKKSTILSSDEKLLMYSKLKLIPHLHDFLKSIDDGSQRLPRQFRNLITSLASQSSVCGYIHPTDAVSSLMKDLVSGLEIKKDPQRWHQLHTHIPILFEVLEGDNNPSAPLEIRPLLNDLWLSSLSPFALCEKTMETSELCDEDEMSFFPSLPVCRSRGVYHKDRLKSDKSCSKTYKGHPSLLPGVFTIYCPHGICHGFQVMQTNESPNIPFTVLRTRFKTAPKVVIYDNACALHAYCMNRDPEFFKNTIFLVDRLHWDNHSGCSVGFCLALYPSLACLNSQVNEQGNAGLKRIKDQLSYMTAEHFMEHCSLYLWNKNRLKKNKL